MEVSDRKPELIIIDNLSSMTSGGDENSNSELDSLLRFLISLRHKGYAIVLVHHSGKSGDQRGASRREDLLDTSIKLGPAKATDARATGAKFAIEFVKTRGEKPTPDKLSVELVSGQHGGVEWTLDYQEAAPAYMKVLMFIRDNNPKIQKEIVLGLKLAQSRVSELLAQAREKGLVDKGQALTKKGMEKVDEFDPF